MTICSMGLCPYGFMAKLKSKSFSFYCPIKVEFAGYTIPHPSEEVMHLRIQVKANTESCFPSMAKLVFE